MAKVTNEEKIKARDVVLAKLNKDHGKNTIGVYGDLPSVAVETISTGSLGVDLALGVGGLPRGRVIEVWGPEASGKTTLTLHTIAEAQRSGGLAAFVDVEHALDPNYAAKLGVDMDKLVFSQPDSAEQALTIVEELMRSNAFDVIVVDSVAALVPQAEIEGEMGSSHMGLQARLMSQALRKLTPVVSSSKTILIFINQIRMKIGVVFGNPETTTGGNALKFYASVRMEIRRTGHIKDGDTLLGGRVKVKILKNKVAPPFKECEFDLLFGQGINKTGEVLDGACQLALIDKSGAWYSYKGERIGQGRENTVAWLNEHPDVLTELETAVRLGYGLAR